jgi:hypothetical protein
LQYLGFFAVLGQKTQVESHPTAQLNFKAAQQSYIKENTMAIKTNGVEFKRFYGDETYWKEGYFVEDELLVVNGVEIDEDNHNFNRDEIKDTDLISISSGYVLDENCDDVCGLESFFRKWRKFQTTTFLNVEVANDKADAVREAIKALGGKVK